ncbi:hypothetical protein DAEQUDRAFT_524238 [Daedalea quercina L-15889]|uniref:Uncharacterized protein n=1 Tax=Daedalea quercina L-15889 TaxID=1314783 RepID=A0A165MBG9_9APHY|nr:hypothetical protein DAEQUDRAFT_524238 [Daedalea quercina L-15889]
MCVGENCAPQAVHYMNAQLAALYENAADCIKHHDWTNKPAEQFKYSHALAEFTYVPPYSRNQTMFHATFDKPHLEFICNHDAILRLKIKKGYYRLDYSRSSAMNYSDKDRVQSLSHVELSFRVSFDTRSLRGKDSKIGNGQNLVQLIVLNLPNATLVSAEPAIIIGRDAFVHYLNEYLVFLHQAGNHVLFSLPDFDDDRYRLTIDYSLMGGTVLEVDDIYGVSVDKINTYLSSVWLKAAMLMGTDLDDWKPLCLAEYRSTWRPLPGWDGHFHLRLGAPRVKPVCSREAIVYFSVDEVLFYEDADFTKEPHRRYSGWEIAVLVDIIHEFDGFVTRCVLDLASARPYHAHCKYSGFEEHDEIAVAYCTRIVEFFSATYLDILETVDLHVIYFFDSRWPIASGEIVTVEEEEEEEEETEWYITGDNQGPRVVEWREMITRCNMFGFDQVIAISQSTINAFFESLWTDGQNHRHSDHSLVKWRYEEFFNARFKPMTLRLLSNGRAIVWVHLEHGHLKVLKNRLPWSESEKYHFENWHLAFEVDLKKVVHTELHVSESWTGKYKDSLVYKEHGGREDRILEHITLDFSHAEFLYEFSSFEGLFHHSHGHTHEHRPIEQVQAVVHYLQGHYLPHLAYSGFNIIHTVPVWKTKVNMTSVSLTTMHFHVYSKAEITRRNWAHVSGSLEPVIAVLGMTEFRPLPALRLEYSSSLIVRASKHISYGTVCISRPTFMEKRLLDLLSLINARTTVIPLFSGVVDGVWQLQLTTWAEHQWRSSQKCKWEEVSEHAGFMKYKWQHRDGWKYEHEGTGEIDNGTYSVLCSTHNYLELPTAARNRSMDIKISGETELEMSFKSTTRQGSSKSTAKWSAVISIQSDLDGLSVKVVGALTPVVEASPAAHNHLGMFPDLRQKLSEHLPRTIDLSQIVAELKVFEGVWHYGYPGLHAYCLANPVFNHKGDVIFELRPQGQGATSSQRRVASASAAGTNSISRQSSRAALSSRPSFLQKVKSAVATALQGDRSSTGTLTPNGNSNGYLNGNGHSVSGSYTANRMTLDLENHEEIVDDSIDESSFLVSQVSLA